MWDKIKNILILIFGGIVGFLLMILGIKNKKIDRLEDENKVKDVIIQRTEVAKEEENNLSKTILDIKNKTSENIEKERSYNEAVEDWNS